MRFKMLLGESARSVRASLSTTFAATMTVLIGMFLLGVAIALGTWVVSWSNHVEKEVRVKVFFCTEHTCDAEANGSQINAVRIALESDERVKAVEFISKEEALQIMRERSPELVQDLPWNPLPNAYEATPVEAEDVEAIAGDLRTKGFTNRARGVEKVDYGKATAKRIIRVGQVISLIFFGLVILLLAASALLIANTIRLSIYARRREIEVMKLVGATNWFIRWPFVIEGIVVGLMGGVLAALMLLIAKETLVDPLSDRFALLAAPDTIDFPLLIGLLMVACVAVSAVGSGLTLRRFLRV